jgi:hypothetical protein
MPRQVHFLVRSPSFLEVSQRAFWKKKGHACALCDDRANVILNCNECFACNVNQLSNRSGEDQGGCRKHAQGLSHPSIVSKFVRQLSLQRGPCCCTSRAMSNSYVEIRAGNTVSYSLGRRWLQTVRTQDASSSTRAKSCTIYFDAGIGSEMSIILKTRGVISLQPWTGQRPTHDPNPYCTLPKSRIYANGAAEMPSSFRFLPPPAGKCQYHTA